ncbi:MAG: hypothetical protein V3W41_01565 [Planctomycetota bacterium]
MRANRLLRVLLAIRHLVVRNLSFDDTGIVIDCVLRRKVLRCGACGVGSTIAAAAPGGT